MSYVFHADAYKVEEALGMYEGRRCSRCGKPVPVDFFSSDRKRKCDECKGAYMKKCIVCGARFFTDTRTQRCCSYACAMVERRRTELRA